MAKVLNANSNPLELQMEIERLRYQLAQYKTLLGICPFDKEELKGDQGEPGPRGLRGLQGEKGEIGPQGIQGIPGPVDSTNAILTTPTINGGIINDPAILEVKQDTKANLVTYATTASDGQLAYATDTKEFLTISQTKTAPFGKKEALKYSIVMG